MLSAASQVNPHKRFRHLYGSRMRAQYRGKILGELSPHVYAIAEQVSFRLEGTFVHALLRWADNAERRNNKGRQSDSNC